MTAVVMDGFIVDVTPVHCGSVGTSAEGSNKELLSWLRRRLFLLCVVFWRCVEISLVILGAEVV